MIAATTSARALRRKAVWGPCRVAVAVGLALFAAGSDALASGRVRPGRPNSYAKPYKLDHELSKRAS